MTEKNPPSATASAPETEGALAKAYEPLSVESRWYEVWNAAGYFQPSDQGAPYTIVIPPPNVTGSLHMGHALNSTLQDTITRYHRMKGDAALWVPGTDHGGIATQNVVEKMLLKEGTNRHDLGREKFLERMWKWRHEAGDNILMQLRRLGASLDWTRTRFTMDEVCSRAVRYAFVELYRRGLLYRGKRLVNWCPRCNTALADIEVEHEDVKGNLWHIRYPLLERRKASRPSKKKKPGAAPTPFETGYIVVATTRPETLLGDVAVAVNPKDRRYKGMAGVRMRLPLTRREIPIVTDEAVDKNFGSGAVKVTPSHDQTDFEIAERQKLPHLAVIGFDGKMTDEAGADYAGLDRFEARKKVVADLEAQGLLDHIEDYKLSAAVCYRCGERIEPLESEQWFLSTANMAKRAREANRKGKVKILPESWEGPYQLWLRNLRDWCVSRQIWWGHRIPVWYCEAENAKPCPPIVSLEDPTSCPTCGGKKLYQDPDVLDTWFSSALWPFSVFHWPDQTPDLKRFYPTSTLVTGHEILYLWVARMVMFGLEFLNDVPFHTVLIHGIVRDKQGRKMSKSLGNVIDPLDLIRDYGADATRFSLLQSAAPGRDMQISKDNFVGTRNFANKIWNASRFALMHIKDLGVVPPFDAWRNRLELADRWILHRFADTVKETTRLLDHLDLDAAARGLYDFFWSDFCDWYLEMVKPRMMDAGAAPESSRTAKFVLATVLEGAIKMLHPFMPFITEELWEKIPKTSAAEAAHVIVASWPKANPAFEDADALRDVALLQKMVTKLRAIRSEMGIPPAQKIEVIARTTESSTAALIEREQTILRSLNSRVDKLTIDARAARPPASAAAVVPGADLYVPLAGLIDFGKERARLEKERAALTQDVDRLNKKLANSDFLTHAPAEEIERTRARLADSQTRVQRLDENIRALS